MPAELRPNWKRKLHQKEGSRKIAKDVNIEETLKVLEQKEKSKRPGGAQNEEGTKESDNVSSRRLANDIYMHAARFLSHLFLYFIGRSRRRRARRRGDG